MAIIVTDMTEYYLDRAIHLEARGKISMAKLVLYKAESGFKKAECSECGRFAESNKNWVLTGFRRSHPRDCPKGR